MEAHIHEWANLVIRWIHFIVGVAWIGASFYFNWLENNLDRKAPQEPGIAGNLWAVHGGGFYHLKKFSVGPDALPASLHWFKWEAYTTWLSGFTLLVVVYYYNARVLLIDPAIADFSPMVAIAMGIASLLGSWYIYDEMCKSRLRESPVLLGALLLVYFTLLAFVLSQLFTGRAAFIHVGAAIGTIMVANVFFVIIPAQKEMVSALAESRELDPVHGKNGLLRSRHNNYLTLPVLFIMISSHFPSTYTHEWNWLVLVLVSLLSIAIRHYYNVRKQIPGLIWVLPATFAGFAGIMWMTAPAPIAAPETVVLTREIQPVIQNRCVSCHAEAPTQPGFVAAPAGLKLETGQQLIENASRVHQSTVVTRIMPLANMTGITEEERQQLDAWYRSLGTIAE